MVFQMYNKYLIIVTANVKFRVSMYHLQKLSRPVAIFSNKRFP